MRCLIIHNPASGPSSDEIFAFTHALAQGGDEVVMRFIGDGMEPEDAVADVREFDRVVVSGGDGTVSNVLDQMRGCGVPTLVFPSGTACLSFNNIGNAPEAAALAKACRAGRTVKVDMGELFWLDEDGNEKRHSFIIIAGSGFDAEIMMKAAPTKNDIGEIAYFLSALATPNPTVAHFTIEHDGIVEELDGICCMAGNTSVIQNDINLFPDCRMNDGMVDIARKNRPAAPDRDHRRARPRRQVARPSAVQDHPNQGSQDHLHAVAGHAVRWRDHLQQLGRLWCPRASAMPRPHRRRILTAW